MFNNLTTCVTKLLKYIFSPFVIAIIMGLSITSCSGGGGSETAASLSIGGTISGLVSGKWVVLKNNGTDALTIGQNGSFKFSQKIAFNGNYLVTIATQPTGETCVVLNGSDSDVSANVTNIKVICSDKTVSIGGTVSGLESGVNVMLTLSTNDSSIIVNQNSNFTFPNAIPLYSLYNVTAKASSNAEICSVANGNGIATSNIANIKVVCSAQKITVSGNISGLTLGSKVILSNTDGDNQPIPINIVSKTNPFSFLIPYDGSYSINVTAPNKYKCSVAPNNLKDIKTNITNVQIICSTKILNVTGSVLNLGYFNYIILKDSSSDKKYDQSIKYYGEDPNFTFKVPYGGSYNIEVTFSDGYSCPVINGSGKNIQADISNVKVNCIQQYFSIYSFQSVALDGKKPEGGLAMGPDGYLYGTLSEGGTSATIGDPGDGGIYKINPLTGIESLVYSFQGAPNDGQEPHGQLILATDGDFYGTTKFGGPGRYVLGSGTIFRFDPRTNSESVIYSFAGTSDGANPEAALIQASDGYLYGTAANNGISPFSGTVFKIQSTGQNFSVIYSFNNTHDGYHPASGLIEGSDGYLYGTTRFGSSNNPVGVIGNGTIFRVSKSGTNYGILYSFKGESDGAYPDNRLVEYSPGLFYGVAPYSSANQYSGGSGNGLIYQFSQALGYQVVYNFKNNSDGIYPAGALIKAQDGNLYGTTKIGGVQGSGTVYMFNPSTVEKNILYSFLGWDMNDGENPLGQLLQLNDGSIWGVTYQGGNFSDFGTVFKFKQ